VEGHRVDGNSNSRPLGMAHGAQAGRFVYQFHHDPTMDRPQRVGVLREHQVI
jgi:hypothetical protein